MSYNQRQTLYVADPIVNEKYGSKEIVGYGNLREYKNIYVISAYGNESFEAYGDNVNKIKRVQSDYPIEVKENCGIYLTKPTPDEKGILPKTPEYVIESTVEHFNRKVVFDIRRK